ncbi:MAG: hypothetical protein ACTSQE_06695 [Candidatus Heimdallarchaeaceae archaeon]
MSPEIIDLGLRSFSDDELEDIAKFLETKLLDYLEQQNFLDLLSDFSFIITLNQDDSNVLTFSLDLESSGAFTSSQLNTIHNDLATLGAQWLEEELRCRTRSSK